MMKKSGFVENDNITLLAKGVLLRGEIRVEGTVRIDGRLEGDLHTTGTVVIGEDGIVQGTITAGIIISSGKIKATVRATERLQLLKTGLLVGKVHAPAFSMKTGRSFKGCRIWALPPGVTKPRNSPAMFGIFPRSVPRPSPCSVKTPDGSRSRPHAAHPVRPMAS